MKTSEIQSLQGGERERERKKALPNNEASNFLLSSAVWLAAAELTQHEAEAIKSNRLNLSESLWSVFDRGFIYLL